MTGPPDLGAKLAAAGRMLGAGDARGAEALCLDVLRASPDLPEAHFMLGVVEAGRGQHAAALHRFDRVLAVRPGFLQALAQKARALDALGRRDEAIAAAEAAEAAADAYTLDTAGVVLTRAGLHERAAEFYARAAKAGNAPGYWYNLGAALQFLGRFEEARAAYRECLKRDARHVAAWAGLVHITKQTREANEIAALTRVVGATRDTGAIHTLGHALAKAHEDLGEHAASLEWLKRAKAGLKARYRPEADAALFEAAKRSVGAPRAKGLAEAQPIFVVGMPRTGTTLVDRILSSHSGVASAGELNDFPNALKRATGVVSPALISPELIERGATVDAATVGRDYVASAKGVEDRFVDKLPLNVFLAPLILSALPDARVICLRRHPADAVLSNYRQDFTDPSHLLDYAFDLEATAQYYLQFDKLVRTFAESLPKEQFSEVWYEDIVGDLEGQVRRMLDFCGLGFEEQCLRFEENTAPVATASAAQVRQPLYASSVGRWRKYRPAIDPALDILIQDGVMNAGELSSSAEQDS